MTAKLTLYNEALGHLRERKLASLSEAREPRRVLDDFYDGVVAYCLARGFWNFAMRAVSMTESATITPTFGYSYAFEKPSDWIRTFMVADNENFDPLLGRYNDEASVIYADCTPLYLKYVSSNASFGLNLAAWPQSFADYVALRLAYRCAPRIESVGTERIADLRKEQKDACAVAGGIDAMDEPPGIPPRGSWVQSRRGGRRSPRSTPGGMIF